MKSRLFVFGIFLSFLFAHTAHSQNMLVLKKKHTAKMKTINMYDLLTIKLNGKDPVKGTVSLITKDDILLDGDAFAYKDIEWIKTHSTFWKGMGRSLEIGGALFTVVFGLNGIIANASPIYTQGNIIFILSLVTVGVILEIISAKKHSFKKGWNVEPLIFPQS